MFALNFTTIKHILWLLPALLIFKSLQAQSYIADIRKLSIEDGLSNRFVNTIYKDSRGFVWIGTEYGLNRYDGYSFKHYTTDNSALTTNVIKQISEDTQQRLWIKQVTNSGYRVSILDLETESIRSLEAVFKDNVPFTDRDIYRIYSTTDKKLWIGTKTGKVYRYQNRRFEHFFTLPAEKFTNFIYADNRFLWVDSRGKGTIEMLKIDLRDKTVEKFETKTDIDPVGIDKNDALWSFQREEEKLLYTDSGDSIPKTISLDTLHLPVSVYKNNFYNRYYMHPANNFMWWVHAGVPEHFFVFHPRQGFIVDLTEKINALYSYEKITVNNIYFEAENRAWVATNDGVFIIILKKNKFSVLRSEDTESNSARGIIADNEGTLYINTYSNRLHIDLETGILKKNTHRGWMGIAKDSLGNIWSGGQEAKVEKYTPSTGQSHYYTYPLTSPQPWELWTLLPDSNGILWLGTKRGLYTLEPDTGLFREFTRYNTFSQLGESSIYHLYKNKEGIWIATSSGLYLLQPGKGITRRYSRDREAPCYIPHDYVLHFYRDKENIFWLATRGGGLIRFNPEDGSYKQFTTEQELSNTIIYAVYEDDYGKLWLPSNYGLMQFDKKTEKVNTYLASDGIAHNEFNTTSHYQAADGRLYFGGLNGVTAFHPEDFIKDELTSAPLLITSCRVLNGKTGELIEKVTSVTRSGTLELSPSDRSLIVEFALLNYENSRQNSYAYKIEGLDKHWQSLAGNSLRINALPYGNYILRIKGKGIKGAISANELAVSIMVNKPFYLKNTFLIACIFAFILLVYGIFRWRLQRLKHAKIRLEQTVTERTREIQHQKDKIESDKNTIEQQAEKLKELDGVKSRFFANISHELRTPLTLILGPLNNLIGTLKTGKSADPKEITKPLTVMQRNSKKLLQLIEEILDLSKIEARKLETEESPVVLYSFIRRLFVTFEPHAVSRTIRYRLFYEADKEIQLLLDPGKTEKIITNFLSNAFKYSPDGAFISLKVTVEDTLVRITIEDNGPGIHPDDLPYVFDRFYQSKQINAPVQGGTGIGLALCKELALLMGGHVHVESHAGKGSAFSYTFPKKEIAVPLPSLPPKKDAVPVTGPEEVPAFTEPLQPQKETNSAAADAPHTPPEEKHTVLVVEDHEDMRDFIVEMLGEHYHLQTAGDGEKALALLQEGPFPDIILSDVMMPNMDGFTLLKHIKANPVWRPIPVILLTARAAQEDRLQGLNIGVDDYLTKPFDVPELLARIRNLLTNYQERKQWQQKQHSETDLDANPGEKPESWDTEWVAQAREIVKREIVNQKYKVSDLAAEMLISESQLLVKMKQITGLTPNEFIREIKLQKARVLLENRAKNTIAEIAYTVGFNTPGYFSTVYEKRFGKRPAAYLADTR